MRTETERRAELSWYSPSLKTQYKFIIRIFALLFLFDLSDDGLSEGVAVQVRFGGLLGG